MFLFHPFRRVAAKNFTFFAAKRRNFFTLFFYTFLAAKRPIFFTLFFNTFSPRSGEKFYTFFLHFCFLHFCQNLKKTLHPTTHIISAHAHYSSSHTHGQSLRLRPYYPVHVYTGTVVEPTSLDWKKLHFPLVSQLWKSDQKTKKNS